MFHSNNKNFPYLPSSTPKGHTSFRLLCQDTLVSKLIGPANKTIKHLIHSNAAHNISITNTTPPLHFPYRVISVTAATIKVNKKIKLTGVTSPSGTSRSPHHGDDSVEVNVSRAQRTLLRVFEKILELSCNVETVCRLLVDRLSLEQLKWTVVEEIKRETFCFFKVFSGDALLPGCTQLGDCVIEIEGNVLAVKKALVAVTHRLQDCPLSDEPKTPLGGVVHQASVDTPGKTMDCVLGVCPSSPDTTQSVTSVLDNNLPCPSTATCATELCIPPPGHASFRLLCHDSLVTKLIGPGGKTIKHLSHSSGAHNISIISSPPSQCPYQVVSIIALATVNKKIKVTGVTSGRAHSGADECVEVMVSRAQRALLRVFEKILEVSGRDVLKIVSCRLLVDRLSLEQLKWTVVEEVKRETFCFFKVFSGDALLPGCAQLGDCVIEIEGNVLAVKKALVAVTHHLQDCPLSDEPKTPLGGVVHQASVDTPGKTMNCVLGVCPSSTDTTQSVTSVLDNNLPCLSTATCTTELCVPPTGHASFRLLCHDSLVTKLIGPGGKTIKHLSHSSAAHNISIISSPSSQCPYQVVSIIALATVNKKIKVTGVTSGRTHSGADECVEVMVSRAQRALLRVFEKILEVSGRDVLEIVSCRLLVDRLSLEQLKCTVVEEIKRETFCFFKVFSGDVLLPGCAQLGDCVIEIEGNVLAVKKALVAVTHHLQDCPLSDEPKTPLGGVVHQASIDTPGKTMDCVLGVCPSSTDTTQSVTSVLDNNLPCPSRATCTTELCVPPPGHIEGNILAVKEALVAVSYHLQDCPVSGKPKTPCGEVAHQASADVPKNSMGSASGVYHLSTEANRTSMVDKMLQLQEVTFRILCSCELAGDIIGRNDTIVKDLERKSGANIKVGPVFSECEERLITINSLENPGMQLPSPAQRALDLVLTKLIEAGSKKGLYVSLSEPIITARLVILSTQASWLLGRKCTRLKAINKATGANIWVYQNDPVLKCACEYDTIVEINGDVSQVQSAVSHVAGRLRENILLNMPHDSETSNETLKTVSPSGPSGQDPEVNSSPNPGQHFPEMQNSDHTGASPEGKIFGKFSHVTDTLSLVAGRLRFWNILNNARTSYGRQRFNDAVEQDTAVNNSPHLNQNYADLHDPDDAGTSLKAGSKIGSVTVLNVTKNVKLEVPEHNIGFVCGENDSNLAHLRQISGAQVLVCEPRENRRKRILAISGNTEDVDLALELLQHYILTDS